MSTAVDISALRVKLTSSAQRANDQSIMNQTLIISELFWYHLSATWGASTINKHPECYKDCTQFVSIDLIKLLQTWQRMLISLFEVQFAFSRYMEIHFARYVSLVNLFRYVYFTFNTTKRKIQYGLCTCRIKENILSLTGTDIILILIDL